MSSSYKYRERPSNILGMVTRPMIDIEVFSQLANRWFSIQDVLVDTGADISVLPYSQGLILIKDIKSGEKADVSGIVPDAKLFVYLHNLKFRIGEIEFEAPVLIAESDDVPPIIGRMKAIDIFLAEFERGKELRLK